MNIAQAHSSFKNSYFLTGNVNTPYQMSRVVRSRLTKQDVERNATLEQLVDFDLQEIKRLITYPLAQKIRQNALNGISQTVYVVTSPKNNKRYGILVIQNNGQIMHKIHLVNTHKAQLAVDDICHAIADKMKAHYENSVEKKTAQLPS